MTHDSDNEIYLGGYGRRSGLGPEFFAMGLLQSNRTIQMMCDNHGQPNPQI